MFFLWAAIDYRKTALSSVESTKTRKHVSSFVLNASVSGSSGPSHFARLRHEAVQIDRTSEEFLG